MVPTIQLKSRLFSLAGVRETRKKRFQNILRFENYSKTCSLGTKEIVNMLFRIQKTRPRGSNCKIEETIFFVSFSFAFWREISIQLLSQQIEGKKNNCQIRPSKTWWGDILRFPKKEEKKRSGTKKTEKNHENGERTRPTGENLKSIWTTSTQNAVVGFLPKFPNQTLENPFFCRKKIFFDPKKKFSKNVWHFKIWQHRLAFAQMKTESDLEGSTNPGPASVSHI